MNEKFSNFSLFFFEGHENELVRELWVMFVFHCLFFIRIRCHLTSKTIDRIAVLFYFSE